MIKCNPLWLPANPNTFWFCVVFFNAKPPYTVNNGEENRC